MIRFLMILCAICLSNACAGSHFKAQSPTKEAVFAREIAISENGPELIVGSTPSAKVIVFDKNDTVFIEAQADLMGVEPDSSDFVLTDDINFDNYKDIRIPVSVGAHNPSYRAWVWNIDKKRFDEVVGYDFLGNVTLNAETQELESFSHLSASEFIKTIYKFSGDQLIKKRELHVTGNAEDPNVVQRVVTKYNDSGKVIIQDTQTVRIDELGKPVDAF